MQISSLIRFGLFSLILLASPLVLPADIDRGNKLHAGNCTQCHISLIGGDGSDLYTRIERRVNSHAALIKQVKRCTSNLGIVWPDDYINDVVAYLNATYYKFQE